MYIFAFGHKLIIFIYLANIKEKTRIDTNIEDNMKKRLINCDSN